MVLKSGCCSGVVVKGPEVAVQYCLMVLKWGMLLGGVVI